MRKALYKILLFAVVFFVAVMMRSYVRQIKEIFTPQKNKDNQEAYITTPSISEEDIEKLATGLEQSEEKVEPAPPNAAGVLQEIIEINESSKKSELEERLEKRAKIGLTKDAINEIIQSHHGYYGFSKLNAEQQKIYAEIYYILTHMEEDVYISTTDLEMASDVSDIVFADHPEIFYCDGFKYIEYTVLKELVALEYSGSYTTDYDTASNHMSIINDAVANILSQFPGGDDYQKVKYVYEYIINNTDYVANAQYNQDVRSVLFNGKSVCNGYAKTMQLLLQSQGIQSYLVSGDTEETQNDDLGHAWLLIRCNDKYYLSDPTWGDPSYGEVSDSINNINYDCMLSTTDEFNKTHFTKSIIPIENCLSMDDNYYVKEGFFVSAVDDAQFKNVIDRQLGQSQITMKFIDQPTYQASCDYLFYGEGIGHLLQLDPGESIYYYSDDNSRVVTIFFTNSLLPENYVDPCNPCENR